MTPLSSPHQSRALEHLKMPSESSPSMPTTKFPPSPIAVPESETEVRAVAVAFAARAEVDLGLDALVVAVEQMFCTPPIAPEPYDAEAPPVTVSRRSMRIVGMKFRSTPSP